MGYNQYFEPPKGLFIITGPMYSSKTSLLVHLLGKPAELRGLKTQLFKPKKDNRFSTVNVVSHAGEEMEATVIDENKPSLIKKRLKAGVAVVGIDEIMFMSDGIVEVCRELVHDMNLLVLAAGLEKNFRDQPFGPMTQLIENARAVKRRVACCNYPGCGRDAEHTQMLSAKTARELGSSDVHVGGEEDYQARCSDHFDPHLGNS